MEAFHPPQGAFQPDELNILQHAFDDAWKTIRAHLFDGDDPNNEVLRNAVSEILCHIATRDGVTDAQTLRSATLGTFTLTRGFGCETEQR